MALPWMLIPMAASVGLNIMGGQAAAEGVKVGAESQARIEAMNREFMRQTFQKDVERQQPFVDVGVRALESQADPTGTGLAKMKRRMISESTGSMSDYVKNLTMSRFEAEEPERFKQRKRDLEQIGLGGASQAGQTSANLGRALAGSYQTEGGVMSAAEQYGGFAKHNLWLQTIDQLSGIPAFAAAHGGRRRIGLDKYVPNQTTAPIGLPMETTAPIGLPMETTAPIGLPMETTAPIGLPMGIDYGGYA